MKLVHSISFLLFVLGTVAVQLKFPEGDHILTNALNNFGRGFDSSGAQPDSTALKRQSIPYWYETIKHQGISAFGPSGYQVFRNVKDFGAKGDGVTDDTAAINSAVNAGGRCGEGCASSTTTPAVVYFPSGTYLISSSILDQYYTQLIGNPNDPPVLKATSGFSGFGLVDADKYYTENLNWVSTNVFARQIRNFVFDLTNIPATSQATGIHWPTAQATSLQNIVFQMSKEAGTKHVGLFCESGSAGFMTDLTFNGGLIGAQVGNQQFTMRNLTFNNCVTAISQIWNWGWVYQGISINNCQKGIDMSTGNATWQSVGSVIVIDSSITNTPIGIITAYDAPNSSPPTGGSLIIENVELSNVPIAIQSKNNTVLAGTTGSTTIAGWGEGHEYTPAGPKSFQGPITPNSRSTSLVTDSKYYVRSKPQYDTLPVSSFSSVRSAGAAGDGKTDDTAALQKIINSATTAGNIVFFDAGTYMVTNTLLIPPGAKLVGEAYSVIMSSGGFFNDVVNPKPVVQVGTSGSSGQVEWSDMIVATQGQQSGATLIEWNLATSGTPSGMWDVHTRIGGFTGSNLQVAQCEKNNATTVINKACIGGFMSMHITKSASGLYMENNWFWTADHDIDSPDNTQLTIYNGRGLLIESTAGPLWLIGTSVEHHTLYQYQLASTQNVYMGFIQTETPYYQPNPQAPAPFTPVSSLNDPTFSDCAGQADNCYDAWGLRIVDSQNILVYGAGHYSFFDNYVATCNVGDGPENCQLNIVDLEGTLSNINIYCLSTVGTVNMISEAGKSLALYSDNVNVFTDNIALFRLTSGNGGNSTSPTNGTTAMPTTLISVSSDTASAISTTLLPTTSGAASAVPTSGPTAIPTTLIPVSSDTASVTASTLLSATSEAASAFPTTLVPPSSAAVSTTTLTVISSSTATVTLSSVATTMGYESPVPTTFSTRASTAKSLSTTAAESTGAKSIIYTPSTAASAPSSSTSVSLGWASLGCYTDDVAGRAMKGYPVPGGAQAMTIESCQATCSGLGYTLAGLEYADECYCGNTIKGSNGPAPDGNAKCDMKCLGNPNEICGGPNRMNLYSHNTSASTSVPATVKEVSTREQTSTSMAAGVTGTGDSAWHYRGCYTDCGAGTLAHGNPTSDTMTVAKCQAMCLAQGYCLAGLEWGDECFCDTEIRNGGTLAPHGNTFCDMPCPGNQGGSQSCGGGNLLDIYEYGFGNGTAIPSA